MIPQGYNLTEPLPAMMVQCRNFRYLAHTRVKELLIQHAVVSVPAQKGSPATFCDACSEGRLGFDHKWSYRQVVRHSVLLGGRSHGHIAVATKLLCSQR